MEEGKNRDFTCPTIKHPAEAQKIGLKSKCIGEKSFQSLAHTYQMPKLQKCSFFF